MSERNSFKKITVGFVVQNYKKVNGEFHCASQEFIAGDQVDLEDEFGDQLTPDMVGNYPYQPFHMITT